MTKEASAVLGGKGVQSGRHGPEEVFQGAGGRLSQVGLQFGKGLLDRIEIRAVGRKVAEVDPACAQQSANLGDFMSGEIVEDQSVALVQAGTEDVFQVSRENIGIDGTFHQERGFDVLVAQGGEEGGGLPMPIRDGAGATLPSGAAPVKAGHFGVQACFIDKHQLAHIPVRLLLTPAPPGCFDIRPILLGGARRFFYSSVPVVPNDATRPSGQ